jgi:hypothetical protein
MSKVTAQDLRARIKAYVEDEEWADEIGFKPEHLAAFDAMAEKAEALDRLKALIDSGENPDICRALTGEYCIYTGFRYGENKNFIKALKAVTE